MNKEAIFAEIEELETQQAIIIARCKKLASNIRELTNKQSLTETMISQAEDEATLARIHFSYARRDMRKDPALIKLK